MRAMSIGVVAGLGRRRGCAGAVWRRLAAELGLREGC